MVDLRAQAGAAYVNESRLLAFPAVGACKTFWKNNEYSTNVRSR